MVIKILVYPNSGRELLDLELGSAKMMSRLARLHVLTWL